MKKTGYQTLLLPDGSIVPGAFDTLGYFNIIKQHVTFKAKRVIDLGCNNAMFSILACQEGAVQTTAIDKSVEAISAAEELISEWNLLSQVQLIQQEIGPKTVLSGYDIAFLGMILHWVEDPFSLLEQLNLSIAHVLIFIHRLPNLHYQIPANGKYFFETEEIDKILTFFRREFTQILLEQDNEKKIELAIYRRRNIYLPESINRLDCTGKVYSRTFRMGDYVYNLSSRLDSNWQTKMKSLLMKLKLPALVSLIPGGYVTKYLDGIDLWGDQPFLHQFNQISPLPLTSLIRTQVLALFKNMIRSGLETNFYLADFTERNLILTWPEIFQIDYETLVSREEVEKDFVPIWQRMLDYLKIPYRFTGDIEELIRTLEETR